MEASHQVVLAPQKLAIREVLGQLQINFSLSTTKVCMSSAIGVLPYSYDVKSKPIEIGLVVSGVPAAFRASSSVREFPRLAAKFSFNNLCFLEKIPTYEKEITFCINSCTEILSVFGITICVNYLLSYRAFYES